MPCCAFLRRSLQEVTSLFPSLLRCQPQGDWMQENADLFRWGLRSWVKRQAGGALA